MSSQASEESDRQKRFFCHSCNDSFNKHRDAVSVIKLDLHSRLMKIFHRKKPIAIFLLI